MIRVILLGFGNVGQHVYKAMQDSDDVHLVQVYNRKPITSLEVPQTQTLSTIAHADVYIVAIPDNAIAQFSEAIPIKDTLVVHTSGGVAMQVLANHNRKGVFYPLQTFSKEHAVAFNNIPICVEAENDTDLKLLKRLGSAISEKVVTITSEERATLHLAAVFVNNFVNHLYSIASEISEENNLDFSLLKPLITETAKKLNALSPLEAQTGPAKRNDTETITKHMDLLKDTEHGALYELLTKSIQASFKK